MNIWTPQEESQRLELRFDALFRERKVTQAEFARKFRVPGGPSMVNQHIKGRRPISLAAAQAYAIGFGCGIEDISPRLAQQVVSAADLTSTQGVDPSASAGSARTKPLDNLSSRLTQSGDAIISVVSILLDPQEKAPVWMTRTLATTIAAIRTSAEIEHDEWLSGKKSRPRVRA